MKRKLAMFLCVVMILTTMSGIGPIREVEAAVSDDLFTEKEEVKDYAYSFAVVGDTQQVTKYDDCWNTNYLPGIYEWILNNKESKNIEYVIGLGDITENNNEAEWSHAQGAIKKLNDAGMPYSLIRGNHDLVGVQSPEDKTADYFTTYMGELYKGQLEDGGFYSEENIWNSWRTFTVGDVDYLMLSLDWGASDAVLSWAGSVIAEHSTYNVIISTHGYLYSDGTPIGTTNSAGMTQDGGAANNGKKMWNKLISQYENIVLVLSGHEPSEQIVVSQDKGVHGNIVTSMLIDHQNVDYEATKDNEILGVGTEKPLGIVTMLYFSEDGKNVQVECYSTARNAYYKESNQFSKEIATVSKEVDACERVVVPYTDVEEVKTLLNDSNAPTLDNYLFAGWYTDEACDEDSVLGGKTPNGTTYALFVPKHVLSVKAQMSMNLMDNNTTNDDTASIRFVSSIDSLLYKEVGFELSYENAKGQTLCAKSASKKSYRKLYVMNSTSEWGKTPEGTFCGTSTYFKICTLKNISVANYLDTVFTVKPYWITMDGTKVYGETAQKSLAQGREASKVKVNVTEVPNGTVDSSETVYWGNNVTLTATPQDGYVCTSLKVNGWDVAGSLVNNGNGTYSYSFPALDNNYTVVPEFTRRIFKDSTTWDVSKQFSGVVSRKTADGKTTAQVELYDQYTDIDITLENVKHLAHYDSTKTYGGRMDVMFQFDVDGDGKYTKSTADKASPDRNTSLSIMTANAQGEVVVSTLGIGEPYSGAKDAGDAQWITTERQTTLCKITDEALLADYKGSGGVDFRIIRSGTMAYVYLNNKQVTSLNLVQNESGVTANTKAIITLRYYEGAGEVVVPFTISNSVDPIFTTSGATGTWDLTDKYNGVIVVDSSEKGTVKLPLAKKYTDVDIQLSGVKEYGSLHNVADETKTSRTDIMFEFDTDGNGTVDKSTSFGIRKNGSNGAVVESCAQGHNYLTTVRFNTYYTLTTDEAAKYNDPTQGVDFRVVRSGKYIYVFVEGKQVTEFDITQNNSGITADTAATITLQHYDVKAEALSFNYKLTDKVAEAKLDIASNTNGTITTNEVSYLSTSDGETLVKKNSSKHYIGEGITLTVTPKDAAYVCTSLNVNGNNVVDSLVSNGDGTYSYSFTALDNNYTVVPEFTRRIFKDSTTWDVSKQFSGVVSRKTADGKTTAQVELYDQYTDIDITLENVKHLAHYDSTKTYGGRMDVMFQFDVDGDGKYTKSTADKASPDRNTSLSIMTANAQGEVVVSTLGIGEPYSGAKDAGDAQWITTERQTTLCKITDEALLADYKGSGGVDFRIIRSGTMAYVYLNNKQVTSLNLVQNESGVTANTKAIITLRYYEGAGEVVVPFTISNSVDPIFTTSGATGTWDLTDKYNGVIVVDSSEKGTVKLPLAKKYTDVDIQLSGVKEYGSLHNVADETKTSRTDIMFEFDTDGNGTVDKSTSFGIRKNGSNGAVVESCAQGHNYLTTVRFNTYYTLTTDEAAKYNDPTQGVDFRVVRSGKYIYVFVEGKQVTEFDITQNNSGITADTAATITLQHYDVKAEALSFNYKLTDKVAEAKLDIASNTNGTITTNEVSYLSASDGKTLVKKNSSKHYIGEEITLTVAPNDGYTCNKLRINGRTVKLNNGTYTFVATKSEYVIEAMYEEN